MLANYLIGLREGLEAALVVSILVAYLVKSDRRHLLPQDLARRRRRRRRVAGASAPALTFGPKGLTFEAQELIGGTAVDHRRRLRHLDDLLDGQARPGGMSGELRSQVDRAAEAKPWSLVVVAMLAVGREGLETALFLWAATRRDRAPPPSRCWARCSGLITAVVLGYLFYRGAVKINLTKFFTWTGLFLIIVAAGVLAYGVHDLQEARFLPGLNNLAFDVSHTIPPSVLVRHPAEGHLQLLPRHHQARARRLAGLRHPHRHLVLAPHPPAQQPPRPSRRRAVRAPRPPSPPEETDMSTRSAPILRAAVRCPARAAAGGGLHRQRAARNGATRAPRPVAP